MKYFILTSILVYSITGFAQSSGNAVGQEFNGLVKAGGGGTAAFQAYSSNQIDGSQFFFPDWQKGEVVTNNKETFSSGYLFIYDKVRQELFIRKGETSEILLGNKDDIKSFTLRDGIGQYNFVNSSLFGNIKPEVFYQVLIDNPSNDSSKLALLKFINGKLVKANKSDMSSQREGIVNDAFVDTYSYYVVKGAGTLIPVQLKTKAVKKTLAELNVNADKYISEHPGAMNEDYLIAMVTELNR